MQMTESLKSNKNKQDMNNTLINLPEFKWIFKKHHKVITAKISTST